MSEPLPGFNSEWEFNRFLQERSIQVVEASNSQGPQKFALIKFRDDDKAAIGFIALPLTEYDDLANSFPDTAEFASERIIQHCQKSMSDRVIFLNRYSNLGDDEPFIPFTLPANSSLSFIEALRTADLVCLAHHWPLPEVQSRNLRHYIAPDSFGVMVGWSQSNLLPINRTKLNYQAFDRPLLSTAN